MKGNLVWSSVNYLKPLIKFGTLLFKVQASGVRGNIFQWFTNYLSCRSQKFMHKDQLSSSASLNAGVPQESVLVPLLF